MADDELGGTVQHNFLMREILRNNKTLTDTTSAMASQYKYLVGKNLINQKIFLLTKKLHHTITKIMLKDNIITIYRNSMKGYQLYFLLGKLMDYITES